MIEFVFMDLDDTVLDFGWAEKQAFQATMHDMGVPADDALAARYSAINDAQWKRLERGELTREEVKLMRYQILFDEMGLALDAEAARKAYEEHLAHGYRYLPGAEKMLHELNGKYRLFLASNGTSAVQHGRLRDAGIAPLFEKIFLSEELGFVKPQREFFDACFAQIPHFDPKRAIMLGDSLSSDIRGGSNAGILTCWYNSRGLAPRADILPDYQIDSLDEFVGLIEGL